jgi:hypothetical protein
MKILAGIILSLFLGIMFVSLFHMSGGMDMSHGMSDCPFMSHEEVICPMNLIDHIGAWKSVFVTFIPTAITFLLTLAVAILLGTKSPHFLYKWIPIAVCIHIQRLRHSTYTYTVRPFQELFSDGILNPKLH